MPQFADTQPNIIFFLIDDMGWTDLTCTGSSFYETPRLDELRREGLMFTDAYAAAPVCSPTRASILSGKYPARVGVTQFIGGHGVGRLCDVPYFTQLPRSEHCLASALRAGGYQTWHVGKWHLGEGGSAPLAHGFDVNVGGGRWGHPPQGYFAPWGLPNLEGEDGDYLTDALTDAAIALLRERDADKPFFLNFWHYAVHTPIQAPAALVEKYQNKARELGLDTQPFEDGDFFPVDHKRDQRIRRRKFQSDPTYAAMVENLDWNVGRVLDALDEMGLRENTLIVFTSDNGGLSTAEGSPTSNAPLSEGKGWMYEGGNREPLLMRWPGHIAPGTTCDVPITSPDFYPTFLQVAGLPPLPQQHRDGESLLPLMNGQGALKREAIFWHYPHYSNQGDSPACALRAGRWKGIEWFETGKFELYNLRDDIAEQHDLAAREPERVAALRGQLDAWKREVGALIPKPNVNWRE